MNCCCCCGLCGRQRLGHSSGCRVRLFWFVHVHSPLETQSSQPLWSCTAFVENSFFVQCPPSSCFCSKVSPATGSSWRGVRCSFFCFFRTDLTSTAPERSSFSKRGSAWGKGLAHRSGVSGGLAEGDTLVRLVCSTYRGLSAIECDEPFRHRLPIGQRPQRAHCKQLLTGRGRAGKAYL